MGKKLAYLCLKQEISKMELISCLKEYDTIKYKMAPESKYVGR